MNECKKCSSKEISVEVIPFEDLHNIMKVFTCLSCGYKKTELNNIQEGNIDAK
jgi:uncharacterized Zn finger protein